ncbi:hypothetical protein ACQ4PT_007631 [Festuca glaucescens]
MENLHDVLVAAYSLGMSAGGRRYPAKVGKRILMVMFQDTLRYMEGSGSSKVLPFNGTFTGAAKIQRQSRYRRLCSTCTLLANKIYATIVAHQISHGLCTRRDSMENKGHHEPSKLPYQLLKQITNDFHEERFIGSGTFGKVYKGVSENGAQIAVKILHNISGPDDKEFHKEFDNLRGLKHPNIVELVGFCNESEEELVVFEGKQVVAERLRMALCFEYVHNGSLQKRISDANMGFNWHTRYRIIKGICEGLKYLHQGLEYPVMHFDLKPDNILLDKNMIPKIADFGLAKLFGEENTKRTMNSVGTCGYWPPEYIKHQIISKEFDIFSLGVIVVKIMTGHEGYTCIADMTTRKFVKHVHENWRNKLCQKLSHTSLEVYCNQVKRCIELALDCLKSNRQERPTIQDIVSSLNETEPMISDQGLQIEQVNEAWRKRLQKAVKGMLVEGYCQQVKKCLEIASLCVQHDPRKRPFMDNIVDMLNETETSIQELALVCSELLDVQPLELCFLPFMPSLEPRKNKVMSSSSSCSLQLNNKGDDRVAFMLVANSPKKYLTKKPLCGVVPPRCAYTLTLTIMPSNQKQPPSSSDSSDFFTLYSVMLGGYDLLDVDKDHVIVEYDNFFMSKQMASGDELQEVMLKVICDQPAAESAGASSPEGHTDRVTQLKFNPKDASSFASASLDGTVKIWSICSDEPNNIMTLDGQVESLLCVDYFIRLDRPHLIAGSKHKTAQIWDLGIMEGCVYELEGPADRITTVNLHPELPILITGSLDGTVRIWDSTTYKLENIIGCNLGAVHAFGCINGSTRIAVGCHQGIAMVDISFPSLRDHTSQYKYGTSYTS